METVKNVLIINYLYVSIIFMVHFLRCGQYKEGFSLKELLLLLIPFMFIFYVAYLFLIIVKEKVIEIKSLIGEE